MHLVRGTYFRSDAMKPNTLVGNNNEPPRKNVESHNCVIPYTIVSWIVSIKTSQNWSKLVKTGRNWSKIVKTGQN